MQVEVELMVPYNRIANAKSLMLEMEGNTLDKLLEALIRRVPALEGHLGGEEVPGASPFLLLINGKVVHVEKQSDVIVRSGDRIAFTRVLAGG